MVPVPNLSIMILTSDDVLLLAATPLGTVVYAREQRCQSGINSLAGLMIHAR